MIKTLTGKPVGKRIHRVSFYVVLIALLITLPFSNSLSFGKYVLDPIVYTISIQSSESFAVTAIGAISGTVGVDHTLTAGPLAPSGALVDYQWQKAADPNGPFTDISGANSNTYTLTTADKDHYIKVVAAGRDGYTGIVSSQHVGPVSASSLIGIGAINGTTQVSKTLSAGPISPSGATVTYQWQRSATPDGVYTNIPGAASNTYTLAAGDLGYYIKVVATGTGSYEGSVSSDYKGPVAKGVITAIGLISGTTVTGQTLTAGTLTPFGATASYQWQRNYNGTGFVDIPGATAKTYTLVGADSNSYIRVIATGTGAYTGTVTSEFVGLVGAYITPITAMGPIGGAAEVGQILTAGTLTPSNATATYQWMRSETPGGTYEDIPGATVSIYTLTTADKDKYIKVKAIGSGTFSGTLTSDYKGPVTAGVVTAIGPISGTTAVGETLTAGTLTPPNATVTYQWQRCDSTNGTYENIPGATSGTYTLTAGDQGYYIKVAATGTGAFIGTAASIYTGPVSVTVTPITAIGPISGMSQVSQTLTAGTLSPSGATATYQWLISDTVNGIYEYIPGQTSNTYTVTAGDLGHYFKVQATGSNNYSGTVTSAAKGPVGQAQITAIGPIGGTTTVGQTLTVGTLTPYGATATYQWQRSDGTEPFTDIVGGTASSYTLTGSDSYRYIRVIATGYGAYTGTVISEFVGRVGATIIPITSMDNINGIAQVGQTLTAGTLSPAGAMATYQWQRSDTPGGVYQVITGATGSSYILSAADKGKYITVVANGASTYSGTVTSEPKGPVAAGQITAIGAISGTTSVGETLTAGTLSPHNATASYQWQRAAASGGPYADIANANAGNYTLTVDDEGYYIRVVATGIGVYGGSAISAHSGPVSVTITPISGIGIISGVSKVGQTLTAGTLSPAGATATYQWMRADTADGTYENIPGATSGTYTLTAVEKDHYIKVVATGSGTYSGTVTSAYKGPVAVGQITAIGPIIGTTAVGQALSVGTLMPYGATATYQWQRSDGADFIDIVGGTASTYTLTGPDSYRYIRVIATGYGAYTGTVISGSVGLVGTPPVTPLTAIGAINGTAQVGELLTAGPLTPAGTATYQWQRSETANGEYININGATGATYELTAADKDKYIKVVARGSGAYSGTLTSAYKGPVTAGQITAIGPVSGTTAVGQTLIAGTLSPSNATATYQWERSDSATGAYVDIPGATSSTYTLTASDEGYYLRITATGYGGYTGAATSAYTGPVTDTTTPITAIGSISGTTQVNQTLTAGTLSPAGATATYQWLRSETLDGTYENIPGATSGTYTLKAGDKDYYIKVQATGSGTWSGTVTSASVGPVAAGQITSISPIAGIANPGEVLTAGTISPYGATVTYQWQQASSAGGSYADLNGATSKTYQLTSANNGAFIRVVATGTGAYTGTATSAYVGRVGNATTPVTAIGAINGVAEVGETLTAGTPTPSNATVTYQWQRSATIDGDYANIADEVLNTYVIRASDADKYIRVVASGSGNYTGTVASAATGPVDSNIEMGMMLLLMMPLMAEEATTITGIEAIIGTAQVGQTLEAGALDPEAAEVAYQWKKCDAAVGRYEDIIGAASSTYTLTAEDEGCLIQVVATGMGAYTGTVTSEATGPVGPEIPVLPIEELIEGLPPEELPEMSPSEQISDMIEPVSPDDQTEGITEGAISAQSDTDAILDTETAPEPEIVPETETAPEPEIVPETETAPEPEIVPETETAPEPEIVPETETAPEPEMVLETETAPELGMIPGTEAMPDAESEQEAAALPESEPVPENEGGEITSKDKKTENYDNYFAET
ncbi:MAG: hypothetical protein PHE79_10610 [Eubacteriales bacterium]|nr:hypothetical protein [Eubacteriales bacterium]